MTLNEAFNNAVKESPISLMELSWSMNITLERLEDLIRGVDYTTEEELHMLRFIFKICKKGGSSGVPSISKN